MWKIAYLICSYFLLCVFCFPFFFRVTHQETTVKPCWSSAEGKINTFTSLWLLHKKSLSRMKLRWLMSVCSLFHMWILSFRTTFYFLQSAVTWRRSISLRYIHGANWKVSSFMMGSKCDLCLNKVLCAVCESHMNFWWKWDHKNEVEDSVSFNLPNRARPFRLFQTELCTCTLCSCQCLSSLPTYVRSCCWPVSELKEERKKKDVCGKEIPRKPPKSKATNKACSSHSRCFKWHSQPVTCHHR